MDPNELIEKNPDFFVSEIYEETLWIKLSGNFFHNIISLAKRDFLQDHLKKISQCKHIKTVIIQAPSNESGVDQYLDFILSICPERDLGYVVNFIDQNALCTYCNIIDQLIIDILGLNKVVIHICQGRVISPFMNLGLACDYRIITEDTLFDNVYQRVGMIPKGGGPFFLSKMLGRGIAHRLLLLNHQISADQAVKYGIVDHVAKRGQLEEVAIKVANGFNQNHSRTLCGVKKMINFNIVDLKKYLEIETQEILRIGVQMQFRDIGIDPVHSETQLT